MAATNQRLSLFAEIMFVLIKQKLNRFLKKISLFLSPFSVCFYPISWFFILFSFLLIFYIFSNRQYSKLGQAQTTKYPDRKGENLGKINGGRYIVFVPTFDHFIRFAYFFFLSKV